MKELLKELCLLDGISGDEQRVREYILDKIKGFCEYSVDNLGNIIAFKKGKNKRDKKLMVSAHMDEVGLIVTSVNDDGSLNVDTVGGIETSAIIGKRVFVGEKRISGVVGSAAIHNISKEDRKKAPKLSDLSVDIGAPDKNEALKYVSVGECVTFDSDFTELGDNKIKAKAIDDRFGCAVMIKLIQSELEFDTFFAFLVQEEVGLRGAKAAAYSIAPDAALVIEATTACDIPSAEKEKRVCVQGMGPVVSFMDRSTIYSKELYSLAFEIANEKGILCQTKTMIAGGNDAGAIHTARGGVKTLAVSLPCRYIHSPSSVADMRDVESSYELVKQLVQRI